MKPIERQRQSLGRWTQTSQTRSGCVPVGHRHLRPLRMAVARGRGPVEAQVAGRAAVPSRSQRSPQLSHLARRRWERVHPPGDEDAGDSSPFVGQGRSGAVGVDAQTEVIERTCPGVFRRQLREGPSPTRVSAWCAGAQWSERAPRTRGGVTRNIWRHTPVGPIWKVTPPRQQDREGSRRRARWKRRSDCKPPGTTGGRGQSRLRCWGGWPSGHRWDS